MPETQAELVLIGCTIVVVASVILFILHLLRCGHEWESIDRYTRSCRKCGKKQSLATIDGSEVFWQDDE